MYINMASPTENLTEDLNSYFKAQQQAYQQQSYPAYEERKVWLMRLYTLLQQEQHIFIDAINKDYVHRSADESQIAEIIPSLSAIKYCLKHLKKWMQPNSRDVAMLFQPAKAYVLAQPLGVIGIMVPWNYPLFLAFGPLCQALAAGNRVMLKMSEYTPHFASAFKDAIGRVFPQDLITVVIGDTDTAKAFTQLPFNHLFFTGSTAVGQHIMQTAAANLTPVTLELGGKSPAIITKNAELDEAVERIAFGKTMNAGQTCVAPDYVLIDQSLKQDFIHKYLKTLEQFYPKVADNPDYTAIINDRHLKRLTDYVTDAIHHGAIIHQMQGHSDGRRFLHCVLENMTDDMTIAHEEIFGPILPVIPYEHLDDAIVYINQRPRPLALYYFGHDAKAQEHVILNTHSGGICLNETLIHVAQEDLPFGGVGASGMGRYHGIEGFKTFSHEKSVFVRPKLSFMKLIYPPYGTWIQKTLMKFYSK